MKENDAYYETHFDVIWCQGASGVARIRGGWEAGDSVPGGGAGATPSWRPASGKNRGRAQGKERVHREVAQDTQRSN